jgi:hypothetical protein
MKLASGAALALLGTLAVLAAGMPAHAEQSLDPAYAAALRATHKAAPLGTVISPQVTNAQTAVPAQVCYTCGGDWPIYAGTLPTSAAATERGSACSGALATTLNDRSPFLCTR